MMGLLPFRRWLEFAASILCGIMIFSSEYESTTTEMLLDRLRQHTDNFLPSMTVSNPELPNRPAVPSPDAWQPEDEIDLRQYVLVLVAWWREIVLIALLTAVIAATLVLLSHFVLPPVYRTSAIVAIARTQSNINFDERFQTTVAQGDATANFRVLDYDARRSALLGLVVSGNVARAVIDQIGDQLEEEEREPAQLLEYVSAALGRSAGGGNNISSDLIVITVEGESPQKVAAIANAWAQNYVALINKLYGEVPAELVASVEVEMAESQTTYEQAQQALEAFIAEDDIDRLNRLIAEKQDIIQSLQQGRQTAITTIVDQQLAAQSQVISAFINAQASNRLLAFNKEQEAKQGIISALIQADSDSRLKAFRSDQDTRQRLFDQYVKTLVDNRLLALEQEQSGRARLFSQYVTAEIENRLAALTQEQAARSQLFEAYASADARSKVAVFNEQVEQKLKTLATYYERRRTLVGLQSEAESLWLQISLGGEASVATNNLALILLKAEVYASSDSLPGNLQLRLDELGASTSTAVAQAADVDALVSVLRTRVSELDRLIALQSRLVFNNEGYDLLDAQRPAGDPLYTELQQKYVELFDLGALTQSADKMTASGLSQAILTKYDELFTVGPLAEAGQSLRNDSGLSQAIQAKYAELFGLGPLSEGVAVLSSTTPIFESIQAQYPALFDTGALSALTEQVTNDTPLSLLSEARAKELLQLQGLEDVPSYSASAEPLLQAIDKLEKEIQALQAQRESQSAEQGQLTQRRDLAQSTLNTLRNKSAELNLTRTVTNSELRFASPAVEPLKPVVRRLSLITTTALAGIVGLMLAVLVVFFANFMGAQPWLAGNLGRRFL